MRKEPIDRNAVLPQELVESLTESLSPVAPAPERAESIKAKLFERVHATRSQFLTIRAHEGHWIEVARGVEFKLLHDNGEMRSFLLRLAPGARLATHGHSADEACIVLEGAAQLGDVEAHAGDFHLAREGSVHGEITTRTGALLFLHGPSATRART
jgi:quercetin dioxygenase-like cupin family protein